MLKCKTSRLWIGMLMVLSLGWMGATGHAQNAALGVVDEDKVGDKYDQFIKAITGLDEQARKLDRDKMPAREFLDEAQGARFDILVIKSVAGVLKANEEAELQGLVDSGTKRREEWTGLLSLANKNGKEARIKELQDLAAKNSSAVTKIANDLFDAIKKRQEEIERQYTDRANDIIKQVAAEKKLAMVMRKKAVVWNSPDVVDITDEVIKRLNAPA